MTTTVVGMECNFCQRNQKQKENDLSWILDDLVPPMKDIIPPMATPTLLHDPCHKL
jgi:hypothetical protein